MILSYLYGLFRANMSAPLYLTLLGRLTTAGCRYVFPVRLQFHEIDRFPEGQPVGLRAAASVNEPRPETCCNLCKIFPLRVMCPQEIREGISWQLECDDGSWQLNNRVKTANSSFTLLEYHFLINFAFASALSFWGHCGGWIEDKKWHSQIENTVVLFFDESMTGVMNSTRVSWPFVYKKEAGRRGMLPGNDQQGYTHFDV